MAELSPEELVLSIERATRLVEVCAKDCRQSRALLHEHGRAERMEAENAELRADARRWRSVREWARVWIEEDTWCFGRASDETVDEAADRLAEEGDAP